MLRDLGIPEELPESRGLVLYQEPTDLIVAEISAKGQVFQLTSAATQAWQNLKTSAKEDGITLLMVSAYRSAEYQADIIRRKLERGQSLDRILNVNAPPGYSEHHTGCAVDIGSPDCLALGEAFEATDAFRWLSLYANQLGFYLSFPKENRFGYVYEPWHWRFCVEN